MYMWSTASSSSFSSSLKINFVFETIKSLTNICSTPHCNLFNWNLIIQLGIRIAFGYLYDGGERIMDKWGEIIKIKKTSLNMVVNPKFNVNYKLRNNGIIWMDFLFVWKLLIIPFRINWVIESSMKRTFRLDSM